jgi:hypothetical protein
VRRIVLAVPGACRERERGAIIIEREEKCARGAGELRELFAGKLRRRREVGSLRDHGQKFGHAVAAESHGGRGRGQIMR